MINKTVRIFVIIAYEPGMEKLLLKNYKTLRFYQSILLNYSGLFPFKFRQILWMELSIVLEYINNIGIIILEIKSVGYAIDKL